MAKIVITIEDDTLIENRVHVNIDGDIGKLKLKDAGEWVPNLTMAELFASETLVFMHNRHKELMGTGAGKAVLQ